ncbi:MAG: hypothetical protein STHCBS139747_008047 [Sporothrix thermara]
MLASHLFSLVATAGLAAAHFQLAYPPWRADSLTNTSYSQYTFPCAGVPSDIGNRTAWPTTGGALAVDLHHDWSYVFVNLALGDGNLTNFNYTLTPQFLNVTGAGTLCIPHLDLMAAGAPDLAPADGQHATLQVITLGASGTALYNCADIVFREGADAGNCTTDAAVSYYAVVDQQTISGSSNSSSSSSSESSSSNTTTTTTTEGTSAGASKGVDRMVLASVVALTVGFVYGMGM